MPATAVFAARSAVAPPIPGEPRKAPSSLLIGFKVAIAPACLPRRRDRRTLIGLARVGSNSEPEKEPPVAVSSPMVCPLLRDRNGQPVGHLIDGHAGTGRRSLRRHDRRRALGTVFSALSGM